MNDTPARTISPQRNLPARASLEHLRHEAKEYLRSLRLQDSEARLADAQLHVARVYGFASWRGLKAYIDSQSGFAAQIVEAVRAGDVAAVRVVLDHHPELVDADVRLAREARPSDTLAMHLTHLAIAEDRGDVLRLLLERGADANARNADGRLPLHDCFELGRDHLVATLLEGGAVHDVCSAACYGVHDRLREILEDDPEQANDLTNGESPIGWSIYGQQGESARILFQHGALVDRSPYDDKAWGPAAMVANAQMARILLEYGADPQWRNAHGDTAIHRAVKSRLVADPSEFVQVLLDAGADPGMFNADERTALDEAFLQQAKNAETYFPVRVIGPKRLERTIEILRRHAAKDS